MRRRCGEVLERIEARPCLRDNQHRRVHSPVKVLGPRGEADGHPRATASCGVCLEPVTRSRATSTWCCESKRRARLGRREALRWSEPFEARRPMPHNKPTARDAGVVSTACGDGTGSGFGNLKRQFRGAPEWEAVVRLQKPHAMR